jgi:hypothetical protein
MTRKEFLKLPLYFVLSLLLGRALGKLLYEWLRPKPKKGLTLGKGIFEQMKEGNKVVYNRNGCSKAELERVMADLYWNRSVPRTQKVHFNGKMYEI